MVKIYQTSCRIKIGTFTATYDKSDIANANKTNDANYLSFCRHNGLLIRSTSDNVTFVRNLGPKINCLFISMESAARFCNTFIYSSFPYRMKLLEVRSFKTSLWLDFELYSSTLIEFCTRLILMMIFLKRNSINF